MKVGPCVASQLEETLTKVSKKQIAAQKSLSRVTVASRGMLGMSHRLKGRHSYEQTLKIWLS